jgi:hypothetical protein
VHALAAIGVAAFCSFSGSLARNLICDYGARDDLLNFLCAARRRDARECDWASFGADLTTNRPNISITIFVIQIKRDAGVRICFIVINKGRRVVVIHKSNLITPNTSHTTRDAPQFPPKCVVANKLSSSTTRWKARGFNLGEKNRTRVECVHISFLFSLPHTCFGYWKMCTFNSFIHWL